MSKFILGFLIGIFLGYMWGWTVMKQYTANPDSCKYIYMNDPEVFEKFKQSMYDEVFRHASRKQIFYYSHDNKIYEVKEK